MANCASGSARRSGSSNAATGGYQAGTHFERRIASEIEDALASARIVVVTGARQVGKTWAVRRVVGPAGTVHYLDDETTRTAALTDPHGFVQSSAGSPVAIDEIQLGGDALIRAIKAQADASDRRGQFLLNGSADFLTVPYITESLAGRAVFLTMLPLSQGEIAATGDGLLDRSFEGQDRLLDLGASSLRMADYLELICRGGFPEAVMTASRRARHRWFSGYVSSMATRDIARIDDIRNADLIPKLLRILAARTAGEYVTTTVARAADCDRRTVERYVSLLEMTGLVHRLPAWSANLTARESRRPKIVLCDTGLSAHLMRKDPESLAAVTDPARGPLVETLAVNELRKQSLLSNRQPDLFHYRDHRGALEADLVTEAAGQLVAWEVKASLSVSLADARSLSRMRDRIDQAGPGAFSNGIVLYAGGEPFSLGDRLTALPLSALWTAPA
ncbi:MAG: ATP-binding protein [Acidimicrobiaceae bacterium]|nr:ATP-binding protein [Acidimicrobiaceae bacterium]